MPNTHVQKRLAGIQTILNGVHQASAPMSSNSKGQEREQFIDSFLTNVLPPVYRFGTGDATDVAGARSGQLDVVVEHSFAPTLPSIGANQPTRLYLAESIAAVIEVKSDISSQWNQAVHTAGLLAPLRRNFGSMMTMGLVPTEQIPLFVVGYTGWKTMKSLQSHLTQQPDIAGVLVIDSGLFASSPQYGGIVANGPWALWGLISNLNAITNGLQAASSNPGMYAR